MYPKFLQELRNINSHQKNGEDELCVSFYIGKNPRKILRQMIRDLEVSTHSLKPLIKTGSPSSAKTQYSKMNECCLLKEILLVMFFLFYFLDSEFREMLKDLPLNARANPIIQLNEASNHFSPEVKQCLNSNFPKLDAEGKEKL